MLDETGMAQHVTEKQRYVRRAAVIMATEGVTADNAWETVIVREDIDRGVANPTEAARCRMAQAELRPDAFRPTLIGGHRLGGDFDGLFPDPLPILLGL